MSPETLSPEIQKINVAAQLNAEQAALQETFPAETIVDQERFERLRFQVGEGVTIVFRGREELPELQGPEGDKTVRKVLSLDERPIHTSGDEYGSWLEEITDEQPLGDPFERAGETGSSVELIASETPLGIVDVALELTDLGIGDPAERDRLKNISEKIKDRYLDDEVLALYDMIYVSGAVDTASGGTAGGYDRLSARRVSPDGPMLVALALVGEEHAEKILELKRQVVDFVDNVEVVVKDLKPELSPREKLLKQPGEQLSESEIETLRDAHFVAVHTTEAMPMLVDEKTGFRILRPTGEYGVGEKDRYARSTVHWSLNHVVTSHIFGNFDNRPVTIVAPLEKLAEVNGAPAVLYGVDTYFNVDPGNGVIIPAGAEIIETHAEVGPFIQKNGNVLRIRSTNITSEDIKSLVEYVGSSMQPPGYEGTADNVFWLARSINGSGVFSGVSHIESELGQTSSESVDKDREEYLKPLKAMYSIIKDELPALTGSDGYPDYNRAVFNGLRKLLSGEIDIEDYPDLTPNLVEGIRRALVDQAILDNGGDIVHSDGMSAYIQEQGFQDREQAVTEQLGIRTGLHQYHSESSVEDKYANALRDATTYVDVPEDIAKEHSEVGGKASADFDWEKFNSYDIWSVLSLAPWQSRRLAVDLGVLTFDHRLPDPEEQARKGRSLIG